MYPSEFLTREMFDQHKDHLDQRLDVIDRRFDVLETIVRQAALHEHPRYVGWGAFVSLLITLGTAIGAIVVAVIDKVPG